jgi:hypothetical protein
LGGYSTPVPKYFVGEFMDTKFMDTIMVCLKSGYRSFVFALLALFALVGASSAWAQVGYVHEMSGTVTATKQGSAPMPVRAGDVFQAGTTFDTGKDGKVILKFEDGQLAALQPNSAFRVDQYNYNKTDVAKSSAAFNFLKGGLRFVSGLIGANNPRGMRLAAGTATIGIRGTDITVLVQNNQVQAASVVLGSLTIASSLGTVDVNQGQFGTSTSLSASPIANAPAAVVAFLNAAAQLNMPNNFPVVTQAAAAASKAVSDAKVAADKAAAAAAAAKATAASATATAAQKAQAAADAAKAAAAAATEQAAATKAQQTALQATQQAVADLSLGRTAAQAAVKGAVLPATPAATVGLAVAAEVSKSATIQNLNTLANIAQMVNASLAATTATVAAANAAATSANNAAAQSQTAATQAANATNPQAAAVAAAAAQAAANAASAQAIAAAAQTAVTIVATSTTGTSSANINVAAAAAANAATAANTASTASTTAATAATSATAPGATAAQIAAATTSVNTALTTTTTATSDAGNAAVAVVATPAAPAPAPEPVVVPVIPPPLPNCGPSGC